MYHVASDGGLGDGCGGGMTEWRSKALKGHLEYTLTHSHMEGDGIGHGKTIFLYIEHTQSSIFQEHMSHSQNPSD